MVKWGVLRVANEPPSAPGCYSTLCRRLSEATLLSDGDFLSRLLRSHTARYRCRSDSEDVLGKKLETLFRVAATVQMSSGHSLCTCIYPANID